MAKVKLLMIAIGVFCGAIGLVWAAYNSCKIDTDKKGS